MEIRHALIVDATLSHATGTAEREASFTMIERTSAPDRRVTLGAFSKLGKVRKTLGGLAKLKIRSAPEPRPRSPSGRSPTT